jgi:hypothetical protein
MSPLRMRMIEDMKLAGLCLAGRPTSPVASFRPMN